MMKEVLEANVANYPIYQARHQEYASEQIIPFRVSPKPFYLSSEQTEEVQRIGRSVTDFFQAVDELYRTDSTVKQILDTGKPEIFLADREFQYLFVRPDLIVTPSGFSICEVETSPFGLALAELLNAAYRGEGFETLVADDVLSEYVQATVPIEGTIVYSSKTVAFGGQMAFLADKVFSGKKGLWASQKVDSVQSDRYSNVYRGFYLAEYLDDPAIRSLLDESVLFNQNMMVPSLTPHLEEKAVLAFLWDKRWEGYFTKQLGMAVFSHLRTVVPPTWIVGQERYFSPGLPDGVSTSVDLASLTRSKRTLVLKPSGFSTDSSWSEGVHFLHRQSSKNAARILLEAQENISTLYVVQQFRKADDISMLYEGAGDELVQMKARVRLTPYFSIEHDNEKLIAIKATGCERTDYIHATSSSINTAVARR